MILALLLNLVIGAPAPGSPSVSIEPVTFAPSSVAETDWEEVWAELELLRALYVEPPSASDADLDEQEAALEARLEERRELRQTLNDVARSERGDPRAELLAVHLKRLAARGTPDATLEPPSPAARPFQGVELWLAVEVLAPGPERAALAVEALRAAEPATGPTGAQVLLSYRISTEDAEALRLRDAATLQEALHRNQRASWSALNLAVTLRNLGRPDEADQLLADQIALETELEQREQRSRATQRADLWEMRALIALGRGDERAARGSLGRALALGSSNAGLVLGRLALDASDLDTARSHFRALVTAPDPSGWALRGWALSQLPLRNVPVLAVPAPASEAGLDPDSRSAVPSPPSEAAGTAAPNPSTDR